MKNYAAEDVRQGLEWPLLIGALEKAFAQGVDAPMRQHLDVGGTRVNGNLLLMPAWQTGEHIGVKLVTVFPDNEAIGLPAVASTYTLFDGKNGAVIAQIDGGELTARRTAAASVLAAKFLARPKSRNLVILGTGRVSTNLAQAYCAIFDIEKLTICSRALDKAETLAIELGSIAPNVVATTDIATAFADADIVSAATLAKKPIVPGDLLRPGTHVDLVGSFRTDMREADDAVLARAGGIYVDTFEGASKESGDITQPMTAGTLTRDGLLADLAVLCRGEHPGRQSDDEITVFKSVGTALEDLAAAVALATNHPE
ncbi:ornithine cyclodeaminase family protein [Devosia rhodophyticola]|uniref:Ornithine cyclodeaminase family protein n=1 Tax=Devosia rhodophyticola TaxID=3026423 RepID=A0ABY7YZ10_9HYPH|nr:ornithine cyclodeaminase family protein [Devosia rhodophyticola]WDR06467.1 ornithine cyclodeaminase family protein [Devosia rhodophyticola]